MIEERIKKAESLDTVHTHTHHTLNKKIGGQAGESYTLLNKRIALIYMPKKIVIKPE